MKKFQFLTLTLLLFITASFILSGCTKKPSVSSQASSLASSASSNMEGNMYKTGLPIVKDKITLKMVTQKRVFHGNFDEMKLLNDLEKSTNVDIIWDTIAQAQYNEKKNLILASNELPDAFFGQLSLTTNDLVTYGASGVLVDMTTLLDKYAPTIKSLMASNPMFKNVAYAPDGKIYGLPRAKQIGINDAPDQMFIYKPWLDKLKLKIPTTLDEFRTVLTAFKTQDPNGNKKADEIPFSFRYKTHHQGMYSLFGSFGLADNVVSEDLAHMTIVNKKVVYVPVQAEYKQAVKYFSTLFAEGLIDKEAFTQDSKQYTAKGNTADVTLGVFMSWNDYDVAGAERAKDYVVVPPMAGPDGKKAWNSYQHDNNGIVGNGFSITKVNKFPQVTMRWVDQFYNTDFSVEVQNAPIGINIAKDASGKYSYLPTPAGMTADEFVFHDSPIDAPGAVFAEMYVSGKLPMAAATLKKYNYVENNYRKYMTNLTFPGGVMFSQEELKALQSMKTDIYNYVNDKQAEWLIKGGIDTQWEEYLGKLKTMKLDEMIAIYQKAYDRFAK